MQSLKIYWSLFLLSTEVAEPTHIQQQTHKSGEVLPGSGSDPQLPQGRAASPTPPAALEDPAGHEHF